MLMSMFRLLQAHRRQIAAEHGKDQVCRHVMRHIVIMQRHVQTRDPIRDRRDRAQIVADEHDGEV